MWQWVTKSWTWLSNWTTRRSEYPGRNITGFTAYPCPPLKYCTVVLSFYPRKTQDEPGHPDLMPMASQNGELSGITITSHVCVCSDTTGSLQPYRLYPTRLLCPWDFPGKNTGVGCHFLLQGIFQTQGSNLCLLHCGWILSCWAVGEAPLSLPPSVTSTAGQGWLPLNYSCHLPGSQSSTLCSPESASACLDNLVSIKCFWHCPSGSFRHWALIVNHFYPMQVFSLPPTALRTQHSLCLVESK